MIKSRRAHKNQLSEFASLLRGKRRRMRSITEHKLVSDRKDVKKSKFMYGVPLKTLEFHRKGARHTKHSLYFYRKALIRDRLVKLQKSQLY